MELTTYTPLLWLLFLPVFGLVYRYSLVTRRRPLKIAAFLFRCLGIVLLVLALCRPHVPGHSRKAHFHFLVDVSGSADPAASREACEHIAHSVKELDSGDTWSMSAFASSSFETDPETLKEKIQEWERGTVENTFRSQSKISTALDAATIRFPKDVIRNLILFSDGLDTDSEGRLGRRINQLRESGYTIAFEPISRLQVPEAAILEFKPSTPKAYAGEIVRFEATVTANRDMTVTVRFVNGAVSLREISLTITKDRPERVSADFMMTAETPEQWEAEVIAAEDHFPMNNRKSCIVGIKGNATVLALHRNPEELSAFRKAMAAQSIEVEIRPASGLPQGLGAMLEFDAILLCDAPATALSEAQMRDLRKYVADFGRALIMTGSENSFGLGGYFKTPVEEMLPVVSRYEKEKEQPSVAMVLVIDKSGSMSGLPIELAKEAAKAAAELLGPHDQIGIVAFDGEARIICDLTHAANIVEIRSTIEGFTAGGGTNMYPAMAVGKEMLERTPAKLRHMIVLSDGQSQPGDFEGIAGEMGDLGFTVSTVALGDGAARDTLSRIASLGRGRYYETDDSESMPRIFARETMEASRSAIREEPFIAIKIGDADALQGIDFTTAPPLLGYVMTRLRPTASCQLLTEQGDPLLAFNRFGLGQTCAFTSDLSTRWSSEWIEWKNYGKLWSQIIRSLMPRLDSNEFPVTIERTDDRVRILVRRADEGGRPLGGIRWAPVLEGKSGTGGTPEIREIGLGLYEIAFRIPETELFSLLLNDRTYNQTTLVRSAGTYPKEYLLFSRPDPSLAALPRLDGLTGKNRDPIRIRKPVSTLFGILGLFSIMTGILLRRLF